jgi:hypothetical protein
MEEPCVGRLPQLPTRFEISWLPQTSFSRFS